MRRGRRMEKLLRKNVRKTVTVYAEFGIKKRVTLNPYTDITLAYKSYDYDNFTTYTILKVHIFRIKLFGYQYLQPAFYVYYHVFNKDSTHKRYISTVIEEEVALRLLKSLNINTRLDFKDICALKEAFQESFSNSEFLSIIKEKFPDATLP
jgi:hypothetical protein